MATWEYKKCKYCGTLFKPRGPKKHCSRECKNRFHAETVAKENRLFIDDEKLKRGCENSECSWKGSFTPEMLDFDHIDPNEKLNNISCMLNNHNTKIVLEISKCRVLCSNCHRQSTKEKWKNYR